MTPTLDIDDLYNDGDVPAASLWSAPPPTPPLSICSGTSLSSSLPNTPFSSSPPVPVSFHYYHGKTFDVPIIKDVETNSPKLVNEPEITKFSFWNLVGIAEAVPSTTSTPATKAERPAYRGNRPRSKTVYAYDSSFTSFDTAELEEDEEPEQYRKSSYTY